MKADLFYFTDLEKEEGKMDEVIDMIKELMADVAKEEGTLYYTMNRDPADPNTIVILERYKDKAALDYHSSTPISRISLKRLRRLLVENLKLASWKKSTPFKIIKLYPISLFM